MRERFSLMHMTAFSLSAALSICWIGDFLFYNLRCPSAACVLILKIIPHNFSAAALPPDLSPPL